MAQSIYSQGSFGMVIKYDVDIVFCIDATGSMSPIIDLVKKNVQKLPNDILQRAHDKKKNIDQLRIKTILFRDYKYDGAHAMEATDFFQFPEQQELFNRIINSIVVDGGGDEPESGLEALAYAISSDWTKKEQGRKRRQIIVVMTDASAHSLGIGNDSPYYDPKMPNQFKTLSAWWGCGPEDTDAKMDYYAKRLLLFAPQSGWWTTITEDWENVIPVPAAAGKGLKEKGYNEIIELLVNSIS